MGMNYGHRMHFARLFSAIIREPRLTRPRKICYKYQRETAEIGVEKNEKKDLDDPGMHHIHEFLHGRMYWQYKQEEIECLDTEELTSVEASKGIKLLKDQDAHEHDHEHNSENDPHVWLDPQNAKYEMNKIKKALIKVDAENKDYYEANYKRYAKECDKLDTLYKEETSKLTKKELVVAHEAFGYLCHAYGLEQMGIEGLSADDEPDPKQMSEVIRFAKEHQVKTIFFEELVSPKVAKTIAKETGANAKMLNPLEGLSNKKIKAGEDYFSVMKQNLAAIKEALSE